MTDEARNIGSSARGGVVFLAHRSAGHEELADDGIAWIGYWERVDHPETLAMECGPAPPKPSLGPWNAATR